MTTTDDRLGQLEALGQRMSEATDGINEVLGQIEDRIVASHVGVAAWIKMPSGNALGFGRAGNHWKLLYRCSADEADAEHAVDSTPLLHASRAARIEAIVCMPVLLDALIENAQHILASIEAASGKVPL